MRKPLLVPGQPSAYLSHFYLESVSTRDLASCIIIKIIIIIIIIITMMMIVMTIKIIIIVSTETLYRELLIYSTSCKKYKYKEQRISVFSLNSEPWCKNVFFLL